LSDDGTPPQHAWSMIIPTEQYRRDFLHSGHHLVHYTNVATRILASGEIFLRNARAMDDQAEIKLGRHCVDEFLSSNAAALSQALNAIHPTLFDSLTDLWVGEHLAQTDQSFIACFTAQSTDDSHGSQYHWDHYGNTALCLDPAFLRDEPSSLALYLVKVTYGKATVLAGLDALLLDLQTNQKLLRSVDTSTLLSFLRHRLFFESVASKGEEFASEREWRLIHAPFLFASADLQPEEKQIRSQTETIYSLKLSPPAGTDTSSLQIKNIIRKVLIRPSIQPSVHDLRTDLISQLKYHGAQDAIDRVRIVSW
jgi:hypothetical protein